MIHTKQGTIACICHERKPECDCASVETIMAAQGKYNDVTDTLTLAGIALSILAVIGVFAVVIDSIIGLAP